MATEKLSATVDADLLEQVRDRAGPRGVSAFVDQALRHELGRARLRDLLDDLEQELGPPDEAMVAEAEQMIADVQAGGQGAKGRRGSAA